MLERTKAEQKDWKKRVNDATRMLQREEPNLKEVKHYKFNISICKYVYNDPRYVFLDLMAHFATLSIKFISFILGSG